AASADLNSLLNKPSAASPIARTISLVTTSSAMAVCGISRSPLSTTFETGRAPPSATTEALGALVTSGAILAGHGSDGASTCNQRHEKTGRSSERQGFRLCAIPAMRAPQTRPGKHGKRGRFRAQVHSGAAIGRSKTPIALLAG